MTLVELTEKIIKNIVKDEHAVSVKEFPSENDNEIIIEVLVSDSDIGRVIGKNGKNLHALSIGVGQYIKKEVGESYKFLIDINDYKEKHERALVRLAKQTAREVASTKIEAKLDSMNSYERRIIHNALTNNKKVYTESEGEEPNRHVVIKPKEDE